MFIEIRKAGFINKGAELMLYAVLYKMQEAFPEAKFVIAQGHNNSSAPYFKRAKLGFYQKAWLWKYGFQWGHLAILLPGIIREMYGLVLERETDIVIDAAGFVYSDQLGTKYTSELARSAKFWKNHGIKSILLPQAFGPFSSDQIKKNIKTAVDNIDLICPRDPISYKHLTDIVGERPNIRIFPDFTNLLDGIVPEYFDASGHQFCLVPNYRMIDKATKEQSKAYLPVMTECIKYLLEKKQKPFILIHEGEDDEMLARQLAQKVKSDLPIIKESNPLKIKGILGSCQGTIGSRFHGLVSALSQGVPSLGTSWSHKYRMLFKDYDFEEGLIDILDKKEEIKKKIDMIIDPVTKNKIRTTINARSEKLKKKTEEMWCTVFSILDLPPEK